MQKSFTRRFAHACITLAAILQFTAFVQADEVRQAEWFLKLLDIDQVHKLSTGSGVTVALPDTGVSLHQDLIGSFGPGFDLTTGRPANADNDNDGHGTEMAGLIAGHGHGTEEGMLGIAPHAKIISIKVTEGSTQPSELESGIEAASTVGAKVINVSLVTGPSEALARAIHAANQADAVVVAGSGNDSKVSKIGYPAALDGVLAVGAVDKNGRHAPFSVPGHNLGICAPGENIVTTGLGSRYSDIRGTSAATAIVSGAVALVRARFPGLSARDVVHRITATATDIGPPGRDDQCGYGVLNIVKALTADVPPLDGGASVSPRASIDAADGGRGWGFGVLGGVAAVLAGGMVVAFLGVRRRGRKRI